MSGDNGTDPVVELEEVTKVYHQGDQRVEALRGLTMAVGSGEFTAISGPSGSGKTTALNLIGALDTPTSGTVRLEGADLGTLSRQELSHLRRDRIGFVFQAYNLLPILSAYENAEIVMAVQGRFRGGAPAAGHGDCWPAWGSRGSRTDARPSSRGGQQQTGRHRAGGSRQGRPWCWPTSRPPTSTPPPPTRCSR